MRYELTDREWAATGPMLPNNPEHRRAVAGRGE
jgi:transposase